MTDQEFLSQDGRVIDFRYELLDKNNVFKKILTTVTNCSIDYRSLSALKYSARLRMKEDTDVDYLNDRIKVICIVSKGNTSREYPLGVYLLSSPQRDLVNNMVLRDIEMYSGLQILNDDKIEERLCLDAGSNVVTEVLRLINRIEVNIPEHSGVLAGNREWEIGTSKIEIINDLLTTINYTSLRVDGNGNFVATPYILPTDREVDFYYIDDGTSVMFDGLADTIDLFEAPNVFVRYTENIDAPNFRSVYENNNIDSPTSTVNRGRRIVSCEFVDAVDQETLDDITIRDASNASQVYSKVTFYTSIMPVHEYMNTLLLKFGDLEGKYQETYWSFDCKAGSRMVHECRRVVNV